jgi:hypothetical protein
VEKESLIVVFAKEEKESLIVIFAKEEKESLMYRQNTDLL